MRHVREVNVCSFKRSGTHLLMASLWMNFRFAKPLCATIRVPGQHWAGTGKAAAVVPWGKLFATHMKFGPAVTKTFDPSRLIYAVRNPYDVMHSLWQFEAEATGEPFHSYLTPAGVAQWAEHVQGYLAAGVCVVRYEDMISPAGFLNTMSGLRDTFGLTPKRETWQWPDRPVGWSPKEGRSGHWHAAPVDLVGRVVRAVPPGLLKRLGYDGLLDRANE